MINNILLNPGPANTSDEVKKSLIVKDVCPREKEFGLLTKQVGEKILSFSNGIKNYSIVFFGGSGTLAMESVITSIPKQGEKILIIENGAYGKRFKEIAEVFNIEYLSLDFDYDKVIDLDKLDSFLQENKVKYVYFTHLETTTGILNNLKEINKIIHKYGAISIVDAMSSFGGIPIDLEENEIDFLISSSNKCIGGMPGISFVIGKTDLIEDLKESPIRSYYSNLYQQYKYFQNNFQFRFTPPVQIMYSLDKALDELLEEGVENRYSRFVENYNIMKDGLVKLGFNFLVDEKYESKILLTILEPKNFDFDFFHDKLKEYGITIYPGKIGKNIKSFRLSVLGNLQKEDIKIFLAILEKVIKKNNIEILY